LTSDEKKTLSKLPKQCIMPLETGTQCEETTTKFYFDIQSKTCYPFEYTGCGLNVTNRFETDNDCNSVCTNITSENTNLYEEAFNGKKIKTYFYDF
jgi:hypothetical protein